MRYYLKEIPDSPVVINGVAMRFDFLQTEDPVLISEFTKCIAAGVGGVLEIDKARYDEEVKKKVSGTQSDANSKLRQRRQELTANQWAGVGAAAQGAQSDTLHGHFAAPQVSMGRDHSPRQQHGLPSMTGPSPIMPDPISIPAEAAFLKPPVGKPSRRAANRMAD